MECMALKFAGNEMGLNLEEIIIKIAELDFCLVLDGAQLNLSSFKNRIYVACSHYNITCNNIGR